MGHRVGLTRVGRGEQSGSRRWVARPDDPDRARAELVAGTCGVDVAAGQVRMRAGGLPLLRRSRDGIRRQAVRAVIDWPHAPETATMTLTCDGTTADERLLPLATGRNRVLLFARARDRPQQVSLAVRRAQAELLVSSFVLQPEREWTVYLVHHSHLDIGYTDAQSTVLRTIALTWTRLWTWPPPTSSWPDDARFRWNIEANWALQDWIRLRPARRSRRSSAPSAPGRSRSPRCRSTFTPRPARSTSWPTCSASPTICATATASTSRRPCRPTCPARRSACRSCWSMPGCASCRSSHNYAGRSVPHHVGGQDLTRPFYWQTPAGDRLLTWFGDTPARHGLHGRHDARA